MSWFDRVAPGLKKVLPKRDTPDNLWIKCPVSGEMVFQRDLEAAMHVTPAGHHMRIGPAERFKYTFDGDFEEIDIPAVPRDPLRFRDGKQTYASRLNAARRKTGRDDAFAIGVGEIEKIPAVVAVQDFAFMGGSLGMAAGESVVKASETAVERRLPLICYTAAGGARMQEGALSLMQMPRTIIAVQMLRDARLPYIVVLTDPTTGGVTASYAMLGDVHLAEPGALIGFAGPRVIEQTIREKLPEGFQRSEYLLDKGMIDRVVHRSELKPTLASILSHLLHLPTPQRARANGRFNGSGAEPTRAQTEPAAPPANGSDPDETGAHD